MREGDPLKLEQLAGVLSRAAAFSDADSNHVVVVHCRTGLHETALVVCALLMHLQFCESAADALHYFFSRRLGEGSEINPDEYIGPSQRRYLHYTQVAINNRGFRPGTSLFIKSIRIVSCPARLNVSGVAPWFSVEEQGSVVFESCEGRMVQFMPHEQEVMSFENIDLNVAGDVRLAFFARRTNEMERTSSLRTNQLRRGSNVGHGHKKHFSNAAAQQDKLIQNDKLLCFLWLHTGFIDQSLVVFTKEQIDIASTDTLCKTFRENFRIEIEVDSSLVKRGSSVRKTCLGGDTDFTDSPRPSLSEQTTPVPPLSGATGASRSTAHSIDDESPIASRKFTKDSRAGSTAQTQLNKGPWRKLQVEQRLVERSRRQRGTVQQVEMSDKHFMCSLPDGIDRSKARIPRN